MLLSCTRGSTLQSSLSLDRTHGEETGFWIHFWPPYVTMWFTNVVLPLQTSGEESKRYFLTCYPDLFTWSSKCLPGVTPTFRSNISRWCCFTRLDSLLDVCQVYSASLSQAAAVYGNIGHLWDPENNLQHDDVIFTSRFVLWALRSQTGVNQEYFQKCPLSQVPGWQESLVKSCLGKQWS